jgi:anti-sigma B factor antagonist
MELQVLRVDDQVTHVALTGRLDLDGVEKVQNRFVFVTAPRRKTTLVDLSGVTFIASLGIGMFVSLAKTLQPYGAKVVLVGPNEMVHRSLQSAGMHHVTPIVASERDALQMLG